MLFRFHAIRLGLTAVGRTVVAFKRYVLTIVKKTLLVQKNASCPVGKLWKLNKTIKRLVVP